MPKPTYRVEIDTITVEPGETLTVYVRNEKGTLTQVEIQSYNPPGGDMGTLRVYCDDPISLMSFDTYVENCLRPAKRSK